jgi:hypothetical protein
MRFLSSSTFFVMGLFILQFGQELDALRHFYIQILQNKAPEHEVQYSAYFEGKTIS